MIYKKKYIEETGVWAKWYGDKQVGNVIKVHWSMLLFFFFY